MPTDRDEPAETSDAGFLPTRTVPLDAWLEPSGPAMPERIDASMPLSASWAPPAPWQPSLRQRVPTRDFRVGYRFVWDLEVPMRKPMRPFQLRPGVGRAGPPDMPPLRTQAHGTAALEVIPIEARTPGLRAPIAPQSTATSDDTAPQAPDAPPAPAPEPPRPGGLKGARMSGWQKSAEWKGGP